MDRKEMGRKEMSLVGRGGGYFAEWEERFCGSFFEAQQLSCHNPSVISEEEDMADLSIKCIDCGAPLIPEVEESCCRCVWCDSLVVRGQVSAHRLDDGKMAKLDLAPKVTPGDFIRPSVKFIG